MNDRGSLAVVVAALAGATLVVTVLVAGAGQAAAGRIRAQSAADAAALAAAPATFRSFGGSGSPSGEAASVAAANGASLVRCDCPSDASYAARTVVVEVAVEADILVIGSRTITASAAAEFAPLDLFDR